jgi:hypothetical protein
MAPAELVRHALDCAKVGIISIALVEALALQLETEATQAARLLEDLEDAERRAASWQEESAALHRQLSRTYG